MIGHPDECTCAGCEPRPPITSGHTEVWQPGETWAVETLPWLVGPNRTDYSEMDEAA